jgi:hypothetical protein
MSKKSKSNIIYACIARDETCILSSHTDNKNSSNIETITCSFLRQVTPNMSKSAAHENYTFH